MTQTQPDQALDAAEAPQTLDVRLSFYPARDTVPARKLPYPPGGGFKPIEHRIDIAPLHLTGLGSDEVAALVRKRVADMALLAQAIAAADIQFSEALQAATLA